MSATLVQTFSFHQPHRIRVKDCVPSRHQHSLSLSLVSPSTGASYLGTAEGKCATQLVHLASQHHGSEYNRMKFGPQGCPILYIPMSFNMPDYVKELQARQMECTEEKAWWPCERHEVTSDRCKSSPPIRQPVVLGPCGSSMINPPYLQQEISDAIAAPLESTPPLPTTTPTHLQLKTSESHPLNISMIVPTELLPIISLHLVPLPKSSPVLFDLPQIYSLDRVTSRGQSFSPSPLHNSPSNYHIAIAKSLQPPLAHLRTGSSISQAIQAAINSGLAAVARDLSTLNDVPSRPYPWSSEHLPDTKNVSDEDNKMLTASDGVEMYDETNSTPSTLSHHNPFHAQDTSDAIVALSASNQNISLFDSLSHPTCLSPPAYHNISSLKSNKDTLALPSCSPITPTQALSSPLSISLGNMFISSCPGKKVRLSGPVQGRCGVFRDLGTDLRRIRDLGVVCIICCLDDKELEFLGVPWSEYSRASREIGMDVLRIPTPEGLTPPSLSSFDSHLSHIIDRYTLQGAPILVHCRGGVGRAGLVACCWILKLGLCGWIETDLRQESRNDAGNARSGSETEDGTGNGVRRDTMQLVERAIGVVRRRRSVKAVETYEQVKFLVDFVEYLREGL